MELPFHFLAERSLLVTRSGATIAASRSERKEDEASTVPALRKVHESIDRPTQRSSPVRPTSAHNSE